MASSAVQNINLRNTNALNIKNYNNSKTKNEEFIMPQTQDYEDLDYNTDVFDPGVQRNKDIIDFIENHIKMTYVDAGLRNVNRDKNLKKNIHNPHNIFVVAQIGGNALNRRGNFFIEHDQSDYITHMKKYKKARKDYAKKYDYDNKDYKSIRDSSDKFGVKDAINYKHGKKSMRQELKDNKKNSKLKDLVKEGRNVNVVRGDSDYIPGFRPKKSWYTIAGGGLWEVEEDQKDYLGGSIKSDDYNENEGMSVGVGAYELSDGHAEFNLLQAEGHVKKDWHDELGTTTFNLRGEADFLHAEANGNWEIGPSNINIGANVEASVVHVEGEAGFARTAEINGKSYEVASAGINGEANALAADASASGSFGVYKDENGKWKVDAGVKLEANAELCSAGGSANINLGGLGIQAAGKVKIGAGAQFNAGLVDGKFNFKIGLALGIGFEFGFSIDVSGAVNNVKNLAEEALGAIGSFGTNIFGSLFG